ncbi:SlyX family protein [Halobacteriovorax sp. YZS-1-1]|uniref:SlyX family protein n=1 Tax=unclassified Halobacteriovorax TaxID=2639665 RepID=UPI003999EE2E
MNKEELEKRLVDLEEKFCHHDHLLGQLNEVVTKQEFIIDELVAHVKNLVAAQSDGPAEQMTLENLKDFKPPHY